MKPKLKTWRITGYATVSVSIVREYTEEVWDKSDEMTPQKAAMLMEDWVCDEIRKGNYGEPEIDETDIEIKLVRKAKPKDGAS